MEQIEETLTPILKLTRDLKNASVTLGDDEARFLVDAYYQMQANRITAAQQLAQHFNVVVLLKGAGSVVCDGTQTAIIASGLFLRRRRG